MITANGIKNASAFAGELKPFGDKTCKHGVTLGFDCEECLEEIRESGKGMAYIGLLMRDSHWSRFIK